MTLPPSPASLELLPHPAIAASPFGPVFAGATHRADGSLQIDYRIADPSGQLRLPDPAPAAFTDGLWQHTCCEAFIAPACGGAYREFNFAPNGAWAIYDFSDYRQPLAAPPPDIGPTIRAAKTADALTLTATLPATLLPAADPWQIGLTVVLETMAGEKSWWALTHTAAQPDFHPLASFTLALTRKPQ